MSSLQQIEQQEKQLKILIVMLSFVGKSREIFRYWAFRWKKRKNWVFIYA